MMNVFVFQIRLWESFGKLLVWRRDQSTVKALLTVLPKDQINCRV